MIPYTTNQLAKRGFNPLPLEDSTNRCFNAVGPNGARSGLYSSDETTQRFWDVFCAASKLLRGGDEGKDGSMNPGTRVICTNAEFPYGVGPQGLVAGAEYTIAWRGKWNHPIDGSYVGVRLMELQRGEDPAAYCDDLPFRADRFKPVVSGKHEKVLEVAE